MGIDRVAAAKEIRRILKRHFPETRFKVRSSSFSGGSAIDIRWVDGPKESQVQELVRPFQYGHFDASIDLYEYSNVRDDLPQAKYVNCFREMSDELCWRILDEGLKRFGLGHLRNRGLDETIEGGLGIPGIWTLRQFARYLENRS